MAVAKCALGALSILSLNNTVNHANAVPELRANF